MPRISQVVGDRADGSQREAPCSVHTAPHEFLGLLQFQVFGGMVGLLGHPRLDELDPPPVDYRWHFSGCESALLPGDSYYRRPPGMCPKTQRSLRHRARPGALS
jgi:hypothetical protein